MIIGPLCGGPNENVRLQVYGTLLGEPPSAARSVPDDPLTLFARSRIDPVGRPATTADLEYLRGVAAKVCAVSATR